jgi:O-antigen/teichoic acid export membrane protein
LTAFRDFLGYLYKGIQTTGSFTQNIAITFSGNVAAQLLGFLLTPFIARIYGPESYGVFALFMAVVSNLSPISTFQLPTGYVSAENDQEFFGVVKITLLNLLSFSGICFAIIFFFGERIVSFFNVVALQAYLYWIPLYLIFMGLDSILLGWNIRLKEFKRSAISKIFSSTFSKIASLLLGVFYQSSASGIIIGNLLAYPIESALKLSKTIRQTSKRTLISSISLGELKSILKKYKEYILFVTPGVFITNLSNLLPVYFFSMTFSGAETGFFALATTMVSMPLGLIVNSTIAVFLQKAAETINQSRGDLGRLVLSIYKKLFPLGFLSLALLAFTSKWMFKLVFGDDWELSGVFVSYLCISFSYYVVYGPLSVLFRLMNFERVNFLTNILFFGLKFLGLWMGVLYNDIVVSVIGYSIASLLSNLISLIIIFRLVKLSLWILVRDAVIIFIFSCVVIWFNR